MNKIIDFVIDSINAGRDRLKMSIVTFYFSLLVLYHWRVFAILFFGGMPMMEKINEIDFLYKDYTPWFYFLNALSILLISIVFMILFPTIMWLSEKILVKISIKRKKKKEDEDQADRDKDIDVVRHQFKLKQEETGNLKESEYVDKILSLETMLNDNNKSKEQLERSLLEERKKHKDSIDNLKNSFMQIETNYQLQIDELNRLKSRAVPDYLYFDLPNHFEIEGISIEDLTNRINLYLLKFTKNEIKEIFNAIIKLKILAR